MIFLSYFVVEHNHFLLLKSYPKGKILGISGLNLRPFTKMLSWSNVPKPLRLPQNLLQGLRKWQHLPFKQKLFANTLSFMKLEHR